MSDKIMSTRRCDNFGDDYTLLTGSQLSDMLDYLTTDQKQLLIDAVGVCGAGSSFAWVADGELIEFWVAWSDIPWVWENYFRIV